MACNITDGKGRPACPGETPGAYDTYFLFNRDQVASYVAGAGDIVEDITFDPGAGFYQVVGKKASVVARFELQDDDTGATNYTHEVDARDVDWSAEALAFGKSLDGANLGVIVHTKGGKFILYGYNDGMKKSVHNASTEAEELGHFYTFRETEVSEPPRIFLDTDEATTEAAILAKVVGS